MENKNIDNSYPRILVISNNAFSSITNNGKTLASFFKNFPAENIAQLYFNQELPSDNYYKKYYRITDLEIIKSFFSKVEPGEIIESLNFEKTNIIDRKNKSNLKSKIKKYNIFRIGREILWLTQKWKTTSLDIWLEEFSPEIIFLCAGDSGFSYDITDYIQKKFNSKLVIYITDDYILPRKIYSPFWRIRRNYIYAKMKKAVQKSDLFITISEEMRVTYKNLFGVDSILAMNMTENMRDPKYLIEDKEKIRLVYTGGLHYKRYETLNLLGRSIEKYNSKTKGKKAFLEIYSSSVPDEKIKRSLNIEGASKYCGSLNQHELKIVLNQCNIPVHVESFESKCIESTKLSISTKIPEYLSLGKPILAIGPQEVASIKYLMDCALCITNPKDIYMELIKILEDNEIKEILSEKAMIKFEKNHQKEIVLNNLMNKIIDINSR